MALTTVLPVPRQHRTFRSSGTTLAVITRPLDGPNVQISRLAAMNTRLETRLRSLVREREKLSRLLDEADAALAAAGIPYLQDNIRERISAYQVFKRGRDGPR